MLPLYDLNPHRRPPVIVVSLIAANLAGEALGSDQNSLTLFDDRGEHPLEQGPKLDLARKLVAHVAGMLPAAKR